MVDCYGSLEGTSSLFNSSSCGYFLGSKMSHSELHSQHFKTRASVEFCGEDRSLSNFQVEQVAPTWKFATELRVERVRV